MTPSFFPWSPVMMAGFSTGFQRGSPVARRISRILKYRSFSSTSISGSELVIKTTTRVRKMTMTHKTEVHISSIYKDKFCI